MKKQRIVWSLLLAAFIGLMGFNEPAFAAKCPQDKPSHAVLDAKLDTLDTKADTLDTKIDTLDTKADTLDTKSDELDAKLGTLDTKSDELASAIGKRPPTWSQILPVSERFVLVMNDEAVLDNETGLVWERSPSTTMNWYAAIYHCYNMNLGGRKGWRLPTVEELTSLVDPTQNNPALPAGHPFQNVQSDWYWSATTNASNTGDALFVNFLDGNVGDSDKSIGFYVWCVRGGHGYDAY